MRPRKTTKRYPANPERWSHDSDKHVTYEFKFKNTVVTPGMTLTLRHDRTRYRFICLVHDKKLNTTWIELLSDEGYKSVRVEKVTKVFSTVKRSRAKKQNV